MKLTEVILSFDGKLNSTQEIYLIVYHKLVMRFGRNLYKAGIVLAAFPLLQLAKVPRGISVWYLCIYRDRICIQ